MLVGRYLQYYPEEIIKNILIFTVLNLLRFIEQLYGELKAYTMILFCVTVDRKQKTFLVIWTVIVLQIVHTIIGATCANAQSGYTLVRSARSGPTGGCIQLTQSGQDQTGAVWFDKRLRLTESFDLTFTVNLGSDPAGADGLAVVFQTQGNQALGGSAGGLGYKGLFPSLGIEFDTNRNFELGDPIEDHIAMVQNGVPDHRLNTNLPPPVSILPTNTTAKDGRDHYVKIHWDAVTHILRVDVDCVQRISQTIDLINTVFSGTSEVIWGFTASTGGRGNIHTVCIPEEKTSPDTIQACRNDQTTLIAPLSSNGQYQWTPSVGLDDSRSRTPRLKVGNSQLYTVQYFDLCAQPKFDTVFVKAKGVNVSIGVDRQVCENDTITLKPTTTPVNIPVTYQWSTGQTTPQLTPKTSGQYNLTVVADGCFASDSAMVIFNPLPKLGLSIDPTYDCPGTNSILLDPQATGVGLQYSWSPGGSRTPTLTADAPGIYTVRVTTNMGCAVSQKFTILNNCPSLQVFVPDAFTPNGDGINDLLKWQGEGNLEARMNVFDRWGEVIFASTDSSQYWDGTYQGKPCPSAIYTWSLEYQSRLATNQRRFIVRGKVLLLK
jgi:gliding motility-associated-like protein